MSDVTASNSNYLKLSLISISLMGIVTTIHHVFRMGFGVILPFGIMTALPFLLFQWYRQSKKNYILWLYSLWNVLFWLGFAFFDGFLDHVLKAVGIENVTFLPGSEAEVVDTVFHLWSREAGHFFYEGTGIMTTIVGTIALYYTARFTLILLGKKGNLRTQISSG